MLLLLVTVTICYMSKNSLNELDLADITGIQPNLSIKKTKSKKVKSSLDKVVLPVVDNVKTKVEDVTDIVTEVKTKLSNLPIRNRSLTLTEKHFRYLTAALEAIKESGPNCSMENIAAKAGVSKPIIYKVFKDKDGLISEIGSFCEESINREISEALSSHQNNLLSDPRELLTSAIYSYVCFLEENQNLYFFLKQNKSKSTLSNTFVTIVAKKVSVTLDELLHAYNMDTGPAELWGNAIVGMVGQATEWWIEHKILSRQRMVDYLVNLLWSGFEGIAINSGVDISNK